MCIVTSICCCCMSVSRLSKPCPYLLVFHCSVAFLQPILTFCSLHDSLFKISFFQSVEFGIHVSKNPCCISTIRRIINFQDFNRVSTSKRMGCAEDNLCLLFALSTISSTCYLVSCRQSNLYFFGIARNDD